MHWARDHFPHSKELRHTLDQPQFTLEQIIWWCYISIKRVQRIWIQQMYQTNFTKECVGYFLAGGLTLSHYQ